ncbi:hypothetical protein [Bradyrhizobium sp. CB2312]|uniref:hypothetical protein n=1 Tax=Bradyrhizobium sp. CB2312 TaxID=3039155 RepID=UPI0024B0855F|nr:hypothetical protein [Bradyrhizobium sp. CB2312]WFU76638.1 hypothetical protein QA642_22870 [Bradyrhizobium sp. CB2312]
MSEVIVIALDIATHVFHAHGASSNIQQADQPRKAAGFFAAQPSCTVALEACDGAHHWARQLTQLGMTFD